jgi:hypothetical protein
VIGGPEHTTSPNSVAAADLDGDGDLDLVSANRDAGQANPFGSDLTIFYQDSPGGFGTAPLVLSSSSSNNTPLSVAAADLDGDGDLDLAFANKNPSSVDPSTGSDLRVFLQLSPGSFALNPVTLGGVAITDGPCALAAADLDGDGDLDLASTNEGGDDLTLFLQDAPVSFRLEQRLDVAGLFFGGR